MPQKHLYLGITGAFLMMLIIHQILTKLLNEAKVIKSYIKLPTESLKKIVPALKISSTIILI